MTEPVPVKQIGESLRKKIAAAAQGATFTPQCPFCNDTKWVEVNVNGVERMTKCTACVPGAEHPVPPTVPFEFHKATFANYESLMGNAAGIRAMQNFLTAASGDLYIYGGIGVGKTRLACTILNEFYKKTRTGMFMRVTKLLFDLLPSTNEEMREALLHAATTQPLLVLDDLGAERDEPTDFTRRTLLMLYEARGDRGLRTIWTSNKSIAELGAILDDERLVSRIAGRSEVVELQTADQRLARRQGLRR